MEIGVFIEEIELESLGCLFLSIETLLCNLGSSFGEPRLSTETILGNFDSSFGEALDKLCIETLLGSLDSSFGEEVAEILAFFWSKAFSRLSISIFLKNPRLWFSMFIDNTFSPLL